MKPNLQGRVLDCILVGPQSVETRTISDVTINKEEQQWHFSTR